MSKNFDVAIIGAGPAGASLAIRLAMYGCKVALIEQQKFPRDKLCGEFISPECIDHFQELGIGERIKSSGGVFLQETVFYSPKGRKFSIPSNWFGGKAFSLSRARMDNELLRRAIEVGVDVFTETRITDFSFSKDRLDSLKLTCKEQNEKVEASIFIDATGRRRYVSKKVTQIRELPEITKTKKFRKMKSSAKKLVAFKVHLLNAKSSRETCEIYLYDGGYGGLSPIEDGLYNLCFIVREDQARIYKGDALRLMREVICSNRRATMTLEKVEIVSTWHSTTLQNFGCGSVATVQNLFAVGDAAGFIDPFTGSGILIALESSKLLAQIIRQHKAEFPRDFMKFRQSYEQAYKAKFGKRFGLCNFLRFLAFSSPLLVESIAFTFSKSPKLCLKSLAQLTRAS
jgi:flavin-dependent dehydrogenase